MTIEKKISSGHCISRLRYTWPSQEVHTCEARLKLRVTTPGAMVCLRLHFVLLSASLWSFAWEWSTVSGEHHSGMFHETTGLVEITEAWSTYCRVRKRERFLNVFVCCRQGKEHTWHYDNSAALAPKSNGFSNPPTLRRAARAATSFSLRMPR